MTLVVPQQSPLWIEFLVIGSVVVLAGVVYMLDSERRIRRLTDEKARVILEEFIFLRLNQKAIEELPENIDADFRVNVMLYRRRDKIPTGERKLWPWRRSLKIEFHRGDYDRRDELELKWQPGEGLCGNAFAEGMMFARQLNVRDRQEWGMTKSQFGLTEHIGSLISIPIYAPEDKRKQAPIGVLNLDTEAEIEQEKLQRLAEEIRPFAKYVGMVL